MGACLGRGVKEQAGLGYAVTEGQSPAGRGARAEGGDDPLAHGQIVSHH